MDDYPIGIPIALQKNCRVLNIFAEIGVTFVSNTDNLFREVSAKIWYFL